MVEQKADKVIWYLMTVLMGVLILGGGAWATSINAKVEKIAKLEVSVSYMQKDLSEIKDIIKLFFGRKNGFNDNP